MLTKLDLGKNQLASIDLSLHTGLTDLNLDENTLTSIDLSTNTALVALDLDENNLASVDLTANTALIDLRLSYNQLASIDLSANTALIKLDLLGNQLTSIALSGNTALTDLRLQGNQLSTIDLTTNTELTALSLWSNQLTSINLAANTELTFLDLGENPDIPCGDIEAIDSQFPTLAFIRNGCASAVADDVDTSDSVFDLDRVLQIDIELDPDDYDVIRTEGRSQAQVWSGCWATYDYTHFSATVTIDGEVFENVDIRKKGFLGSLSASRPSFKLNLDDLVPGRRYEDLERFTLNNDRQDPSHTHQCITYQLFRDAGLPAPRCNFARVSVNGEDLGIYSSVEAVKKHFLRRNFSDDTGNLYEAQLADFGDNTKENFQLKLNPDIPDRSDLDGVVEALKASDEDLPSLLGQFLDIDQYIDFWAMETVTGHWDGAAGNANNHLIYRDPDTNLFNHIPWGTDGSMALYHPFRPTGIPLYRYTLIPTRLYEIEQYRNQYHSRILYFLDTIWDEDTLNADVDRIRDLTGTPEQFMAASRDFIAKQRARLLDEINGVTSQTEHTKSDNATVCNDREINTVTGSFVDGQGSLEFYKLDEPNMTVVPITSVFVPTDEGDEIQLGIWGRADGFEYWFDIRIEEADFGSTVVPFQGVATTLRAWSTPDGEDAWHKLGWGGEGSIIFDEPPVRGEPASFHFSAEFWLHLHGERF